MNNTKQTFVSSFHKNSVEVVRLTLTEFKGNQYLDIRVYYDASENEQPDWRPSRKGITLSLDLIEELEKGLRQAQKHLAETSKSVQARRSPGDTSSAKDKNSLTGGT